MLAVHWSPVKNTKNILKNGISKSKNGLYCFPLTGKKIIDQWWVRAFNQSKSINKFAPILEMYLEIAKAEIENNPDLFTESSNNAGFLEKTFSDWQIILSRAVSPSRIIKVVSDRNEYGKVLYKQKKRKQEEPNNVRL